jgi:hypothetical protein
MDIQHWADPDPQDWLGAGPPPGLGRAATKETKETMVKRAILENMVKMNEVKRM